MELRKAEKTQLQRVADNGEVLDSVRIPLSTLRRPAWSH
jgi:hypothetical protein